MRPLADAATVEVIRGALIYGAEEMGIVLRRAACSPNIKERMDLSCAVVSTGGETVAQAEHIPVHLGSLPWGVARTLEWLDRRGTPPGPGDVVVVNDPYLSGTHLPDLLALKPVFRGGEPVAYVAAKAHHSDVGGSAPGSLGVGAGQLLEEGLVIPPVRLVRSGSLDRDLLNLLLSNTRTPREREGDVRAQLAALDVGERRVLELVERYGAETFSEAVEEILDYGERRMRARLSAIPPGRYRAEDFVELPGGGLAEIRLSLEVGDGSATLDYSGTAPQAPHPVNAVLGVTLAASHFAVKSAVDPASPPNGGAMRPVSVVAPEGTLVNPVRPAPVAAGNVETSQRIADVALRALAEALPGRVPAASQGTMNNVAAGGPLPGGSQWTFYETIGGGSGGRPGSDGVDGVHVNMTNTMNTPVEAAEIRFPLIFLRYEFRRDSGGPGRWRGGCGVERSWRLLGESAVVTVLGERTLTSPWGLAGGLPGAGAEYVVVRSGGREERLPSKATVLLRRGDVLRIRTPGGGGYGDPLERDPAAVARDVADGLVSPEAAAEDYGVVASDDGRVDWAATRELRRRIRGSRSASGPGGR